MSRQRPTRNVSSMSGEPRWYLQKCNLCFTPKPSLGVTASGYSQPGAAKIDKSRNNQERTK